MGYELNQFARRVEDRIKTPPDINAADEGIGRSIRHIDKISVIVYDNLRQPFCVSNVDNVLAALVKNMGASGNAGQGVGDRLISAHLPGATHAKTAP
jgi:hypothetical protein